MINPTAAREIHTGREKDARITFSYGEGPFSNAERENILSVVFSGRRVSSSKNCHRRRKNFSSVVFPGRHERRGDRQRHQHRVGRILGIGRAAARKNYTRKNFPAPPPRRHRRRDCDLHLARVVRHGVILGCSAL